ncbi:MAG: MFS transporter [Pseudomonadota bacterium]
MNRDQSPPRPVPYRWLIFALLAAGYLLVYFHRLSPAVVAVDMMRDLSAGGALMGLLGSAYFYPYALMQLPAGLLSDSWGPRKTITVSFVLAGGASIFFGLAPTASWAIVARVLVGLGVSMLFVPAMKALTSWFKRSEFAMMAGVLMAMGGLGVLTAAAPLAYASAVLGWRGSFVAIGVVTLVLAAALWFLVRNKPEDLGFPPVEEPLSKSGAGEAISLKSGITLVLRRRAFWPVAAWLFFTAGIFFTFGGLWGGPYLMHVFGLTKAQAGRILSMQALAMIVGSPLFSYLSDRVHSRKKLLVADSLALIVVVAPLAFFPGALTPFWLHVHCFLFGLTSSAIIPIGFTTAKELFPTSMAGTSVGLVNFFPFLGGALLQPLVGWMLQARGPAGGPFSAEAYGWAFWPIFVSSLLALGAALLATETFGGFDYREGRFSKTK